MCLILIQPTASPTYYNLEAIQSTHTSLTGHRYKINSTGYRSHTGKALGPFQALIPNNNAKPNSQVTLLDSSASAPTRIILRLSQGHASELRPPVASWRSFCCRCFTGCHVFSLLSVGMLVIRSAASICQSLLCLNDVCFCRCFRLPLDGIRSLIFCFYWLLFW